jgi:AcrR family transcriptional regulator
MPRQVLTKERIIETAIALIEEGEELTFSTVSKRLESRSQALYTYFANVNELRYAIVAWAVQAAGRQVQDKLFGQSGLTAIMEFSKQFRVLALRYERLSRFVLLQARTIDYPDVVAAFDQLRRLLHQLLNSAFRDETVRSMASRCIRDLIVGDIINVGTGWFAGGTLSPDDSFNQLLRRNLELFQHMDSQQ